MSTSAIQKSEKSELNPIKHAFELALPSILAYLLLGTAFSLVLEHMGFEWYWAPIMSLLVYAGSVQFVAVAVLALHGSYLQMFIACVVVASRFAFYGLGLIERYKSNKWLKTYLIFSLVDANYAILSTCPSYKDKKQDLKFCAYLSFFGHASWALGSLIGALLGDKLPEIPGLEFVITSFFMALLVEQYFSLKSFKPFIVAIIAGIIAILVAPDKIMLVGTLIGLGMLLSMHKRSNQIQKAKVKK